MSRQMEERSDDKVAQPPVNLSGRATPSWSIPETRVTDYSGGECQDCCRSVGAEAGFQKSGDQSAELLKISATATKKRLGELRQREFYLCTRPFSVGEISVEARHVVDRLLDAYQQADSERSAN